MKKAFAAWALSLALINPAAAATPSDSSISELMAVTEMKTMMESLMGQINTMMDQVVRQALQGKQPTASEQAAINNMKTKMIALFRNEYQWETLEPSFRKLYKETLTQDEVDGMLAFYKSPAGQAVIKKMPVIMQKAMEFSQSKLHALIPKMQAIQEEFAAELKASGKK